MPTVGREALSSRLTSTLQVAPMVAWLGDAYLLIWLLLHRFPGLHGLGNNGIVATANRLMFLLFAVLFLLLPAIAWWAAGLRRVATDGSSLLISHGSFGEAAIPLAEIVEVGEWGALDLRTVRVTFDRKTAVGRIVRFLAPTHDRVVPGEPHRVVLRLRELAPAPQEAATQPQGSPDGGA